MEEKRTAAGHLAAMFTILIWGTTFTSTKVLLRSFAPIEILFFRFVLGFIALCLLYPHRLKLTERKQEIYFAAAGLCGVTLYFLLENIALTYTMASNVGVICAVSPLFVVIISRCLYPRDKLNLNFILGFAAAIAGIVLISFGGDKISVSPIGDSLAFTAAIIWAIYSILTKKISTFGYNTIQTTRRAFFYGIIFMIPALFFLPFSLELQRFTEPVNLLNLIYLGLGASAVCFVTWGLAVKILGAVKTSAYIYAAPVVTVITATIILKEQLTIPAFIGILLTLAGLLLSEGLIKPRRKAPKKTLEEEASDPCPAKE